MRNPVLPTVALLCLVSAPPARAATIALDNTVLHTGGTATLEALAVGFQNGQIDGVGLLAVSPYELAGLCAGASCFDLGTGLFNGTLTGDASSFAFAGTGTRAPVTPSPSSLLFTASFTAPRDGIVIIDSSSPLPVIPVGAGVSNVAFATLLAIPNITRSGTVVSFLTGVRITFGPGAPDIPSPQIPEVPEPASLVLLGSGLIGGLGALRQRRRRSRQ
jgi:hypothetical protein